MSRRSYETRTRTADNAASTRQRKILEEEMAVRKRFAERLAAKAAEYQSKKNNR